MGFVERLLGLRVYLDANVFIYALEGERESKRRSSRSSLRLMLEPSAQ